MINIYEEAIRAAELDGCVEIFEATRDLHSFGEWYN
jgi:hypothetical protein